MTTSKRSTYLEPLKAAASRHSTETLLASRQTLDEKADVTSEERLVAAAIAEVIEERHGLSDLLDEIYEDVEYNGTYGDALRLALSRKEAS